MNEREQLEWLERDAEWAAKLDHARSLPLFIQEQWLPQHPELQADFLNELHDAAQNWPEKYRANLQDWHEKLNAQCAADHS